MKCFECSSTDNIHRHHVIPKSLGGKKTIPLCGNCHGKIHGLDFTNHSFLTKQALAEKKKQGVKLGYNRKEVRDGIKRYHEQKEANPKQIKTVQKEVDQKKQSIKTIIVLLKKEKKSLREIAKYLNDQGLRTSRGKMFLPTSVNRLLNYTNLDKIIV